MTFDISSPRGVFHAPFYIRHNQRRLEHLATLGLPVHARSVLEPGAGIGDHSLFYLDRGCTVTAVEPRSENVEALKHNVANAYTPWGDNLTVLQGNVDHLDEMTEAFDVVHSHGLLYHVPDPAKALELLAARCSDLLILETCVSMSSDITINALTEPTDNPTQAFDGTGCRPTRPWIVQELNRHFPHVYLPRSQPAHDEFPTDWTQPSASTTGLTRAIFNASRTKLSNPALATDLLERHTTHLDTTG